MTHSAGVNGSMKLAASMAHIYDPWNNPAPVQKTKYKRRKPKIPKAPRISDMREARMDEDYVDGLHLQVEDGQTLLQHHEA